MTTNPQLTAKDCDWLRRIRCAGDGHRDAQGLPPDVARKLAAFGFATIGERGAAAITDEGREALLEQDMRDAEER